MYKSIAVVAFFCLFAMAVSVPVLLLPYGNPAALGLDIGLGASNSGLGIAGIRGLGLGRPCCGIGASLGGAITAPGLALGGGVRAGLSPLGAGIQAGLGIAG